MPHIFLLQNPTALAEAKVVSGIVKGKTLLKFGESSKSFLSSI